MPDQLQEPDGSDATRGRTAPVLCLAARGLSTLAAQIVSVAAAWQIYDSTESALLLGMVGLVQFLPGLLLVLMTGAAADRFDRRRVIMAANIVEAGVALGLAAMAMSGRVDPAGMLAMLLAFAIARAFFAPAAMSLLPSLVSAEQLPRMIAIQSSIAQCATVGGPVLGGFLFVVDPTLPYFTAAGCCLSAVVLAFLIPRPRRQAQAAPHGSSALLAGFSTIWNDKVLLGAISLDMFAVLLGGTVMLMPIFARDILEVGPTGLGLLRGAAAGGAIAMAVFLSFRPIRRDGGRTMLAATAVFGLSTIVFGLSTSFPLSIAALLLMGGADMVSVYVRSTLIQLNTPDWLRGRVNAVNLVFIGASNELGGFRAGVMAAALGAVSAVVVGGLGTVAVALAWVALFPELRRMDRLDRAKTRDDADEQATSPA